MYGLYLEWTETGTRIKGKNKKRVKQESQPTAPAAGTGTAVPILLYYGLATPDPELAPIIQKDIR
jgi:hypothetical protein